MASKEENILLLLTNREKAFARLYEQAFPLVASFIHRMGGSLDDARDIFQDSLIVFYEKALEDKLHLRVSAQAYILGIAKHLWSRKFNESIKKVSLNDMETEISIPDDFYVVPDATHKLARFLELAGQKCMNLLQSFYYEKMSMENIAERFGYGSTRSATVQKYKCLEKVREKVKASDYEEIIA